MKKILLMSLLFFATTPSIADGWRCGNNLVNTGESKGRVIAKCGPPFSTNQISSTKKHQGNENDFTETKTVTEELIYKEDGKVYRILTFENGQLSHIAFQRCGITSSPLCY